MSNPLDKIKSRVRDLRAYSLVRAEAPVKINQNENPWEASTRIKERSLQFMRDERLWSRYPDFVPISLHEKLADFSGWAPDGVIAGNGSNELIQALLMVTVGEGRRVLISEPTFALYRQITIVLGGEILSVPLTSELKYDITTIRSRVKADEPDVTIICSPNNPTGCTIDDEELAMLLEEATGLVVVDEAYFEFSGHTVVPLLEKYANLVVLRTFSKAMAMAALRVGYLLAAPELVREIGKAVLPYNLNAFSQRSAEIAIEMYEPELRPRIEEIIGERERLYTELGRIRGLAPVRSEANFMVVRSAIEPRRVFSELLHKGILVRDVSGYPMLGDFLRISVGRPEENDLLIAALKGIFA